MLIKGWVSRREKGRTMSLVNAITDKNYYGLTNTPGASQVQNTSTSEVQNAGISQVQNTEAVQANAETGTIDAASAKDLSFRAQLQALTAQNAALTSSFGSSSTSDTSSLLGGSTGTSSVYGSAGLSTTAALLGSGLSSMGSLLGSTSGFSSGSSMYGESMGMSSGASLFSGSTGLSSASSLLGDYSSTAALLNASEALSKAQASANDDSTLSSSLGSTDTTVSALNTIYQDTVEKVTEDLTGTRSSRSIDLNAIFEEASERYGIPSRILKAVAKQESGFKTTAVSNKGAMGVMQLMPATARSLGVSDPFDARQNIMGGAKLLASNLQEFGGNLSLALAAYNAGSGNVRKYGGIPPFKRNTELC